MGEHRRVWTTGMDEYGQREQVSIDEDGQAGASTDQCCQPPQWGGYNYMVLRMAMLYLLCMCPLYSCPLLCPTPSCTQPSSMCLMSQPMSTTPYARARHEYIRGSPEPEPVGFCNIQTPHL